LGLVSKSATGGYYESTSRSLDPEILGLMLAQQMHSFESALPGPSGLHLSPFDHPRLEETDSSDSDADADSSCSESCSPVGSPPKLGAGQIDQINSFIQCVCYEDEREDGVLTVCVAVNWIRTGHRYRLPGI
jgi:hypothetical protein